MATYEQITIVGYCGQDPTLRMTPDGRPLANMTVATSRCYKSDSNGEYQDQSTWFNVLVGGKQAEFVAEHGRKGSMVLVTGKFMPDRKTGRPKIWTTKAGEPAASYEILADLVRILDRKDKEETDPTFDDIPF